VNTESDQSPPAAQDRLIGVSAAMQRLYSVIHQASAYAYPALISGEKGTGKKLAAKTIHSLSKRKEKAFIVIDFSRLAPTLVEAELFGYEKGAFAGASQAKWGQLAFAREGTVLLKEVGDLPFHLQARFFQMLQDKEFTAIGSAHPIPFKARVLATTSRDLNADVERGTFRRDLFLRLNTTQISLVPLRERKEDIPLLIDYFLEKYEGVDHPTKFSPAAIHKLCVYDWPGNIRELQKHVRQAISSHPASVIDVSELKLTPELPDDRQWAADLTSCLDDRERHAIVRALRDSQGDKSAAARLLGIAESALQKRIQYFDL
jgi:transcriptional regulator with PAS, ATPase and Fis domain